MLFQAFDTETINRPGHGEACLLIKMSSEGPKFLEFPTDFQSIFEFLKGGSWLAYNVNFDIRAIVHPAFLPMKTVDEIGLFGRSSWHGLKFHFVSGKFLQVFQGGKGGNFKLYDLKQFYGTSLAEASKAHLPKEAQKVEIPKRWYNEMDTCLRDNRRGRVLAYAAQDVIATQSLADKLLKSIGALSLNPRGLSSCATLSRMKYGRILKSVKPPAYHNRIFESSFFGGRIETRLLGAVGPCKLYDLHSAYPSVIAKLVDPKKGKWINADKSWTFQNADYGHYEITAQIPLSFTWGPLAVRHRNCVIYPVGVVRTACGVAAIRSLRQAGIPFSVQKAYEFFSRDKTPIFPDIERLYLARQEPVRGHAIKLLLNAIFGLCAERKSYYSQAELLITGVRMARDTMVQNIEFYGPMANFILAQHITESIRMRLWEVLNNAGKLAYFVATDGVLVDSKFRLCIDPGLGRWGLKGVYNSGVILGCGRYLLRHDDLEDAQSLRGFPARKDTWKRLSKSRRRFIDIPCLETQSLRQWAGGYNDDLNVLQNFKRRLVISDNKRHWPRKFVRILDAFEQSIESLPFIVGKPDELGEMIKCQSTQTPKKPLQTLGVA